MNLKENKKEIQLNFKIEEEVHEKLRKISYEKRISMSKLCREGINLIIKKYEKNT